jgi:hypothetical protein
VQRELQRPYVDYGDGGVANDGEHREEEANGVLASHLAWPSPPRVKEISSPDFEPAFPA